MQHKPYPPVQQIVLLLRQQILLILQARLHLWLPLILPARGSGRARFSRGRDAARGSEETEGDGRFASVDEESRIYFTAASGEKSKQSVLMQQHRPHLLAWSPCNG